MIITAKEAKHLAKTKNRESLYEIFGDIFDNITKSADRGYDSYTVDGKELIPIFQIYKGKHTYYDKSQELATGSGSCCDVTYDDFISYTKVAFEALGYEVQINNSFLKVSW